MRLEEATPAKLGELSDHELRALRERANQLHKAAADWRGSLDEHAIGIHDPIPEDRFLDVYGLITEQMEIRKLRTKSTDLDKRLVTRRFRRVDVAGFPPIMVRKSVAVITGAFAHNPHRADRAEVWVDGDVFDDDTYGHLEKRLGELLNHETDGPVVLTKAADSLVSPVVPLYDLVLVPHAGGTEDMVDVEPLQKRCILPVAGDQEIEGVVDVDGEEPLRNDPGDTTEVEMTQLSKLSPNEHASRQLPAAQFDDFLREDDKLDDGVHVIFGLKGGKSKVQSIRFSADKFTPKEAKTWLDGHGFKETLEAAARTFVKNEEQRIVGGIVYCVGELDSQDDYVDSPAEIWKALESHMLSGATIKVMHDGDPVDCPVVECFQAEADTVKGGDTIPSGAWFLTCKVLDDDIWAAVKSGELTGFSMAGMAHSEEASPVV